MYCANTMRGTPKSTFHFMRFSLSTIHTSIFYTLNVLKDLNVDKWKSETIKFMLSLALTLFFNHWMLISHRAFTIAILFLCDNNYFGGNILKQMHFSLFRESIFSVENYLKWKCNSRESNAADCDWCDRKTITRTTFIEYIKTNQIFDIYIGWTVIYFIEHLELVSIMKIQSSARGHST